MKIRRAIKDFNQNIFDTLSQNQALREQALNGCSSPQKVMNKRLTGDLALSEWTLTRLGHKLYYYLTIKQPKTTADLRYGINRCFSGDVSVTALTHIRFLDVAQIAMDLGMSVEQVLYGTNDVQQIAKFNYANYGQLDKVRRRYFMIQSGHHETVAKNAQRLHNAPYRKSYTEIAKIFGISRQNLYNYLNGTNALLRKKSSYQAMCSALDKSPVQMATYPLMPKRWL